MSVSYVQQASVGDLSVSSLSIDIVPNTNPPRFLWQQKVSTPIGDCVVKHEGMLLPTIEGAIAELIAIVKRQAREIKELKRINEGLTDRVAAQSELLTKRAETLPARKNK